MDDTLFVVLIITILLVTTTVAISLMIWAEKTNSLFVRLAILVPFHAGLIFELIVDIVKHFEAQKIILAVSEIFILIIVLISLVIGIALDYKKWSAKLIARFMDQEDDSRKKEKP